MQQMRVRLGQFNCCCYLAGLTASKHSCNPAVKAHTASCQHNIAGTKITLKGISEKTAYLKNHIYTNQIYTNVL